MLPHIVIHNTISLDGRLDWVSDSPETMMIHYEMAFHWQPDAILMGADSIYALGGHEPEEGAPEEPRPRQKPLPPGTENLVANPRPLLIVPDSRGRIHNWHLLLAEPWWRDIIVLCSVATPASYLDYLDKKRIPYLIAGTDHVDIISALERLQLDYGIDSVRTDCGGTLNGVLLRLGLVREISVIVAPSLAGGHSPLTLFRDPSGADVPHMELTLTHLEKVRNGFVWLRYDVTA